MMRQLITKIFFYIAAIFVTSLFIFYFTKNNILTDFTAKQFLKDLSKSDLAIHEETAYERRVVANQLLLNKNKHFKTVIIGSSRVMQFGKMTGFSDVLNLGVSGASLEDVIIVDSMLNNNNISYDNIIFDYNPWYCTRLSDERYKRFLTDYRIKESLTDILKFRYNYKDIVCIYNYFFNKSGNYSFVQKDDLVNGKHFMKLKDGSIIHKSRSVDFKKEEIKTFVRSMYKMKNFHEIDSSLLFKFINIVKSDVDFGHRVFISLTPFHPDFYEAYEDDARIANIHKSEELLHNYIPDNVVIIGSFSPSLFNLADSEFLDGFHISNSAIRRYYSQYIDKK